MIRPADAHNHDQWIDGLALALIVQSLQIVSHFLVVGYCCEEGYLCSGTRKTEQLRKSRLTFRFARKSSRDLKARQTKGS
jgi:hypothetical protein